MEAGDLEFRVSSLPQGFHFSLLDLIFQGLACAGE